MSKILISLLACIPLVGGALEWQEPGTYPSLGERIIMTRVSHSNQYNEIGWVVHYSPTMHKRLVEKLTWAYIGDREGEAFDLGIPLVYTP